MPETHRKFSLFDAVDAEFRLCNAQRKSLSTTFIIFSIDISLLQ